MAFLVMGTECRSRSYTHAALEDCLRLAQLVASIIHEVKAESAAAHESGCDRSRGEEIYEKDCWSEATRHIRCERPSSPRPWKTERSSKDVQKAGATATRTPLNSTTAGVTIRKRRRA